MFLYLSSEITYSIKFGIILMLYNVCMHAVVVMARIMYGETLKMKQKLLQWLRL